MRIYTEIMHLARYDKYCHGLTQNPYYSGHEIYILSHHFRKPRLYPEERRSVLKK